MENKFEKEKEKIGIGGYIWLIIATLFFSGLFRGAPGPLKLLDLSTYLGSFGTIVEGADPGFVGDGGSGMYYVFTIVLTIAPGIMFCIALMEAVEYYGGLRAAGKLLSPILRPVLGVPGEAVFVLISNLQSSDSSAALIKSLVDSNSIEEKHRKILLAYALPGPALLGMMITYGVMLYSYLPCSTGIIILVVILMKFAVAEIMRLFMSGKVKRAQIKKEEGMSGNE